MLKVKFMNNEFELVKAKYNNGRLAILLAEEMDGMKMIAESISVNIPEARFFREMSGEDCENDCFVDHVDGFEYDEVIEWLLENDLIEPLKHFQAFGFAKSGFNNYIAVRFKEDKLKLMEDY
ncbi:DUF4313 domain-containing protein [Mammaliicoccus sciuri]|uniref:DUF4313 domain-containing protein n=1 Tax=Mammaliicoccus sciuri TaxID=1296 RepID=UPI000E687AE1|nr:DUF4313 domain-containing protein [Mammaliicoccus sciuri]RIN97165.1 DUF4313 domain-containing protein [Mammaliicoccus sciuri]